MRRHMLWLCLILAATVVVGPAWAEFADAAVGNTALGVGTRAIGMGDAFVAVADDVTALYWNPAGLADNTGFKWHTISIGGGVDNLDVIDELADVAYILDMDGGEIVSPGDFNTILNAARNTGGQPIEVEGSLMTGFALGPLAIGAYAQSAGVAGLTDVGGAGNQVNATANVLGFGAVGVGYGRQISRHLQMGVAVKQAVLAEARVQKSYQSNAPVVEIADDSDDDNALTADLGLRYKPEENMCFGLVVRNITSPDFTLDLGAATGIVTREVKPSVHFGLAAFDPAEGLTFAADIHNLTAANNASPTVHFGLEKIVNSNLAVRAGLRDSQFTWGVTGSLGPLTLEIASAFDYNDMFAASLTTDF